MRSDLEKYIRNVPDFPKPGIGFKDITTLLKDGKAFYEAINVLEQHFAEKKVDKVVGIESRGFIFGAVLAYKWQIGFVPIRKPGKLPANVIKEEYELEYGTDVIEMHADAIQPGEKILLVDDLLATGGTAAASVKLIERLGGDISGIAFLIELTFLNGIQKLSGYDVYSIINYAGE